MKKAFILFFIATSLLLPCLGQSGQLPQSPEQSEQVQEEAPMMDIDKGDNVAAWQAVRTFYEYTGFIHYKSFFTLAFSELILFLPSPTGISVNLPLFVMIFLLFI